MASKNIETLSALLLFGAIQCMDVKEDGNWRGWMSWTKAYWDTIDQVYWWPPYAGLRSISQKLWRKDGDRISVPAELVNKSGPLYTRERKAAELHAWLHSQEEPLNHIFDLTFSIAADEAVRSLLFSELGIEEHESLSLDRPGRLTCAPFSPPF